MTSLRGNEGTGGRLRQLSGAAKESTEKRPAE